MGTLLLSRGVSPCHDFIIQGTLFVTKGTSPRRPKEATIEFLGLWEKLHNVDFKGVEFDAFRNQAGSNAFTMSPSKWIESTNAVGIVSKSGRNGGTFAHSDIAFEFASWISPEFKLYIIKDYNRLKHDENSRLSLSWNLNREISKLNYRIHTDAYIELLGA